MTCLRKLVFISHVGPEDDELTRWLCGRLTAHGYRVWADLEQLLGGCGEVVRNLGKHVTKSEHSTEERELTRAMLGCHGIVFSRDGRVATRFDWTGFAKT